MTHKHSSNPQAGFKNHLGDQTEECNNSKIIKTELAVLLSNLFKLEQVCGQFSVDFSIDLALAPLGHSTSAPSTEQTDADFEIKLEVYLC